jgi:hypothetical protein
MTAHDLPFYRQKVFSGSRCNIHLHLPYSIRHISSFCSFFFDRYGSYGVFSGGLYQSRKIVRFIDLEQHALNIFIDTLCKQSTKKWKQNG